MLSTRGRDILTGLVVLSILVGSAVFKTRAFQLHPSYADAAERLVFETEGAFHYRHARMLVENGALPEIDRPLQMPDGLRLRTEITIFMERVAAHLYRALAGVGIVRAPFPVFLVHFICWFSSLSVLAVAMAAAVIWQSRGAAVAAALVYALAPMSTSRTIGNYIREDFALPLLFLFIALFLRAVATTSSRRQLVDANVAGLFLLIALASWHMSRFFLLVFAAALPVLAAHDRRHLARPLWILIAWGVLASFLIPVLAAKNFFLSAPMSVLYATAIVLLVAGRRRWSPRMTFGGIVAAAVVSSVVLGAVDGHREYSHVYTLIQEKLLNLGRKPIDPADLPFEARILWVPPFTTPGAYYLVTQGGVVLLWGLAALAFASLRLAQRRLVGAPALIAVLAAAYGILFALVQRISSLFVFFLALLLPVLLRGGRRSTGILVPLLVVSLTWQLWRDLAGPTRALGPLAPHVHALRRVEPLPNMGNDRRLLEWVRFATDAESVFLAWYATGPKLLTYADRGIVLHSKWESAFIRERFRRFLRALYSPEDEMIRLCEEVGADHVVTQIDFALDDSDESARYQAGVKDLPGDCTAALMHFRPGKLRRFSLVYQDSRYRVFRFHPAGQPVEPGHRLPREVVWDEVRPGPDHAVRRARELLSRRARLAAAARADLARGDLAGAAEAANRLLLLSPDSEDALLVLASIRLRRGNGTAAMEAAQRGLETRPHSAPLLFMLGDVYGALGKPAEADRAYRSVLSADPAHVGARARLAERRKRE